MTPYDVAVIGLGSMGSFLVRELAVRKVSVVGFDQYAPPHHEGSHSGETRVFRTAYYEHPSYTPLAVHSGFVWDRLGEEIGKPVFNRTGLLSMGPEDSGIILGIRKSAALHRIPILSFSSDEISKQYPALRPPDNFVGLLEETAGWIDVEVSLQETLKRAKVLGANLHLETPVLGWERGDGQVRVKTKSQDFVARQLVITAGSWSSLLLRNLSLPLKIKRKILAWFDPLVPEYFKEGTLPIFAFATDFFYGFPNIWGKGVKVALHEGGDTVAALPVSPATTRDLDPIVGAASKFLAGLVGPKLGSTDRILRTQTCLYTMTPDEDFIIDRHPQFENVCFAAGFSGHGFKFAPVVGEALADLALEGKTELPIDFLRLKGRFPQGS
jgi:monomeric sarcosine oxidase